MMVTVLKTTFQRLAPKIRNYRDYSNFDNGMFGACLFDDLSKQDVGSLDLSFFFFFFFYRDFCSRPFNESQDCKGWGRAFL